MAEENKGKKNKRPTAEKRKIQGDKKYAVNRAFKSKVKTQMRKFQEAIAEKDGEKIQAELCMVYSLLDKGVKRGIFKKNMASRQKSRLTLTLKA